MDNETRQIQEFTIFWTIFGPDTPALMPLQDGRMLHYELSENTNFPIYISGNQLKEFDQIRFESLEVTPLNMAAGALLGCRPPRPFLPLQGPNDLRPLLSAYLDRYSSELGYENLENLVFELSSVLREDNGRESSIAALKNAEYLNVNFHKILNDLLLDLWGRLAEVDDSSMDEAVKDFYIYLSKAKLDQLHPESIVWFNYARAVALLFFEVNESPKVNADDLTEAIKLNENQKLRERLTQLRQEKRFDRRLF